MRLACRAARLLARASILPMVPMSSGHNRHNDYANPWPYHPKRHPEAAHRANVAGFYPLAAVDRFAFISFWTQISAAPATGSVSPGIVTQPPFLIISPRA